MIFTGKLETMTAQRGFYAEDSVTRATLNNGLARYVVRLQGWKASDFAATAEIGREYLVGGQLQEFREPTPGGAIQCSVELVPYLVEGVTV